LYIFYSSTVIAYNVILPDCIPELHFGMHMYSNTMGLVLAFIVFAVVYTYEGCSKSIGP